MYRKHFGLTRLPFTNGIDTGELFPSNGLREIQVRLAHLVELRVHVQRGGDAATAGERSDPGLGAGHQRSCSLIIPASS
jgi:hypothetical protein